jgi:phage I-like protein
LIDRAEKILQRQLNPQAGRRGEMTNNFKDGTLVHAYMANPSLVLQGDQLPGEIQWMPPGIHEITAMTDDGPEDLKVIVNEQTATRIAKLLQDYSSAAAAGQGDRAYFDFNHNDEEASAHVIGFFWGGNDPVSGGVRAKVEWTGPGRRALLEKAYRRFSPSFYPNKAGEVVAAPLNMGGLVNRAAFRTIAPILSRYGGDKAPTNKTKEPTDMAKTVDEQLADLSASLAKNQENITALCGTVDKLVKAQKPEEKPPTTAKDPNIISLEAEVKALKDLNLVQAKANAGAAVRKAVSEGKIPPQDAKLIEQWTNILLVDAKNAELLEALPVNAALKDAIKDRENKESGTGFAGNASVRGESQGLWRGQQAGHFRSPGASSPALMRATSSTLDYRGAVAQGEQAVNHKPTIERAYREQIKWKVCTDGFYKTFTEETPGELTGKEGWAVELTANGTVQLAQAALAIGFMFQKLQGSNDVVVRLVAPTAKAVQGGAVVIGTRVKYAAGGKVVTGGGAGDRNIGIKISPIGNQADTNVCEIITVVEKT